MAAHTRKKVTISIIIPFLVFIIFFSIMIWQKYRSSYEMPATPPEQGANGHQAVTLFFAVDGTRLAREARVLDHCDDDDACLKNVLAALLNGPVGAFEQTMPEGTAVYAASIDGDQATIEFNSAFSDAMLSGSSAEMLAVYAVVNTVAVNFPKIQRVKLNIGGNTGTILRHLDLSEPLQPDYSLEQPPPPEPETPPPGSGVNN
ncbi:MAG: GerMN domain-containing protein [Desulfuromonadaceae bacterium]|nr:GerMN domain-containing protein [Desulfuromonadaceae bacterium]